MLILILHIIGTETWEFQDTWGEVFVELAKQYPSRCLEEAFPLTAYKQTDVNRSIGGYVLSAVVFANNGENSDDLLKKIFAISQDPSNKVRKFMCKALLLLTKVLSKKQIEIKVVPEVLKLVEDDSAEVLESSLPLFCEFMEYCSYQYKEEVVEILKNSFFTQQMNELAQVKLKYFGRIIVCLRLCIDEEFRSLCITWFEGFFQCSEIEIKILMAQVFPALLYIVGSMTDQLLQIFKTLESIESYECRKILAKYLGDICSLSNCNEHEMLRLSKGFVEDEKTLLIILEQFFIIGKSLKQPWYFIDVLIGRLKVGKDGWRTLVQILNELNSFVTSFDCSKYLDTLFFVVFELFFNGNHPVRNSSAKLLAEIYYKSLAKHEEYSTRVIFSLGKSNSCNLRISYIQFCVHVSSLCSHKYFCQTFLPTLLDLSRDPVKSVVYCFASHFCKFRIALPFGDSELVAQFKKIISYYFESRETYLVEVAVNVQEKLDKLVSEHYNAAGEAKENLKIKLEKETTIKEIPEVKGPSVKKNRKSTLVPRGSSHNPVKRFSLVEIDKSELTKVIQRVNRKKGVK